MKTESGELIAVVGNQIIQAVHKLGVRQQKTLFLAIAQIARDDTKFNTTRIKVSDFARMMGVEASGQIFREMEQVTTSLLQEVIHIRLHDGARTRRKFQWLSHCDYKEGEGVVILKFHDELEPWFLQLKQYFTQLKVDRIFRLKSTYSIRFFERIEMQRGLNKLQWTMTMEELREWLGTPIETYPRFGLLRARTLDPAQIELDAKSDWSFSFVTIKTGKKITGVEFTMRPSRSPKVDPIREKWKHASPALRALVLSNAKNRPVWEGKTDAEILDDVKFWDNLQMLFDEVERGQKSLALD